MIAVGSIIPRSLTDKTYYRGGAQRRTHPYNPKQPEQLCIKVYYTLFLAVHHPPLYSNPKLLIPLGAFKAQNNYTAY